ncbi:A disintegrin and metalloproteinase with thrombospondin motifs like isoform X2 [Cotesia typhae]
MTPEEFVRILEILADGQVPEFDTVPISTKSLDKNDDLYITLNLFGQNLKMWLTPNDGILAGEDMPIFSLKTNERGNIDLTKFPNFMRETLPRLYENKLHAATFAVNYHRNRRMSLTGFIGDSYIQPVPSRFVEHARRYARTVNNSFDHEGDDHVYHFVHKIPHSKIQKRSVYTDYEFQSNPAGIGQKIVYPEILVIVDYNLTRIFNRNVKDALLYILSFWNGVDMRYRSIEHPRVRLNIAGIVFTQDSQALPYLVSQNGKVSSTTISVTEKGKFLYLMKDSIPLDSYDIAVTMTPNTLCDLGSCNVLGQVRKIGKACDVNYQKQTMDRVMIMRDRGGFDGIETASHELGHLLGMNHDGSVNRQCPDEDGYIMATSNKFSQYAFDWSECSLANLETFLSSPQALCLFNRPNQGRAIHRFLPGQLKSPHEQCRMINGIRASIIDDSICTQLKCEFPYGNESMVSDLIPEAAEGTSCGIGKICLHGNCIFKTQVN